MHNYKLQNALIKCVVGLYLLLTSQLNYTYFYFCYYRKSPVVEHEVITIDRDNDCDAAAKSEVSNCNCQVQLYNLRENIINLLYGKRIFTDVARLVYMQMHEVDDIVSELLADMMRPTTRD